MANNDLEIIEGDGSSLEISEVYDHLKDIKLKDTKDNKPKDIIIPNNEKKEENDG